MLCHKHKVLIYFCTPDPDFDNKCLFSDVRDRNGMYVLATHVVYRQVEGIQMGTNRVP